MQPGLVQPGLVQPGLVQPGLVQPWSVQPWFVQPWFVQPGEMETAPSLHVALLKHWRFAGRELFQIRDGGYAFA